MKNKVVVLALIMAPAFIRLSATNGVLPAEWNTVAYLNIFRKLEGVGQEFIDSTAVITAKVGALDTLKATILAAEEARIDELGCMSNKLQALKTCVDTCSTTKDALQATYQALVEKVKSDKTAIQFKLDTINGQIAEYQTLLTTLDQATATKTSEAIAQLQDARVKAAEQEYQRALLEEKLVAVKNAIDAMEMANNAVSVIEEEVEEALNMTCPEEEA